MSDELHAVIEAEIDELLRDFDNVSEEWREGYLTTGEAIHLQQEIRRILADLRNELAH